MTGNMQADGVQSRQAVFVRCCLKGKPVTSIGDHAFCTNNFDYITGTVNIPSSITSIGKDAFYAAVVLIDYSLTSTGKSSALTDAQKSAADIDKDGKIDSSDASFILRFYSYVSTGGTVTDMSKWLNNLS